jgi:hypothetical protein
MAGIIGEGFVGVQLEPLAILMQRHSGSARQGGFFVASPEFSPVYWTRRKAVEVFEGNQILFVLGFWISFMAKKGDMTNEPLLVREFRR